MYHTFTGSSRRPRQVDLSGRKANPWAASPGTGIGSQSAVQNAQNDRQQRQRQREELAAARRLQRVWRGHQSRTALKAARRDQWDKAFGGSDRIAGLQKSDLEKCSTILLSFVDVAREDDVQRLLVLSRHLTTLTTHDAGQWPSIYIRLDRLCLLALAGLSRSKRSSKDLLRSLLGVVQAYSKTNVSIAESISREIFLTCTAVGKEWPEAESDLVTLTALPLATPHSMVYNAFARHLLTAPQPESFLRALSPHLNWSATVDAAAQSADTKLTARQSLWLLGNTLFLSTFRGKDSGNNDDDSSLSDIPTRTLGKLLGSAADFVDAEAQPVTIDNHQYDQIGDFDKPSRAPLNKYLKENLSRMVNQRTIRGGLGGVQDSSMGTSSDLATYVLTLLRVFYDHADDIRMWLYLGPIDNAPSSRPNNPISFFWKSARQTTVVNSIMRDAHSAVKLITNNSSSSSYQPPSLLSTNGKEDVAGEWKVILIFLELYTFVLKLMDDEEFLGHAANRGVSRTNPLSTTDLADLVTFLNHLGFTLYYRAQQINQALSPDDEPLSRQNLARAFTSARGGVQTVSVPPSHNILIAGLPGVGIEYVKDVVTGLVRSIYERDSRRKFLPKGHWLMTSEFDMANFITEVVAEEENRHQVQEMDEDDNAEDDDEDDTAVRRSMNSNMLRIHEAERKQRMHRKASRRRYLESVAPRLEILQNMPFIIPFDVRVQIFRAFVRLDQAKRRNGFVDPDMWRQSVVAGRARHEAEAELVRHHAKVRRKHEFEDALAQFYDLGPALKEPIQITFVDEFDMPEAGIDGGGVTKEFLTSATSDAFRPEYGLFRSTPQHQLYPNPTALAELRLKLDGMEVDEDESINDHIRECLENFEFAGRIIGKCLYEGILVDITFAGFFLNRWALAASSTAKPNESMYRTNINDLRDLDEELYQGLLSLKNYQGNAEDLALSFSITDEIPLGDGSVTTVEQDLIPNGSDMPVKNDNKLIYISRVARYRLQTQSYRQTQAFLRGLSCIIEPSWLAMFNQSELQTLVGGAASSINIEDLRRNTVYGGLYVIGDDGEEHPCVKLFWQVMHELSDEDKGRVLKFVTSTPRAPLLGFGSLFPKFSIRDSGDDEARFPTTSTCINLLKLPRYRSKRALMEKLTYAVNSGAGFDLS